ncbi:MAG: hypothetical protein WBA76_18385 [Phormidesmis sp.]
MTMTAEQLELPYFIPTSENVSQILAELRAAEAPSEPKPLAQEPPQEQPELDLILEDAQK